MLELVPPSDELESAWREAHLEWGPGLHEDGFGIEAGDDVETSAGFAAWLRRLEEDARPAPDTALYVYRWIVEDGAVLGGIALRHRFDRPPPPFGHIGYGVRPSARGRGVATQALGEMLVLAAGLGIPEVLLVTAPGNTASARTVERNGGHLEPGDGIGPDRWWVRTG